MARSGPPKPTLSPGSRNGTRRPIRCGPVSYTHLPERRAKIPAVTHVDGTGRLQTVDRASNPRYYALIEAFSRLTGVPMVLNTSFNENEPVVCRPEEALDCFLRTKMDVLVLGNNVVRLSLIHI